MFLFVAVVLAVGSWALRKRKERHPVEFRLRRGPGESLRRKLAKFDEGLFFQVSGSALAPIIVAYGVLWLMVKIAPHTPVWLGLAIVGVTLVVCAIISGRWLWRQLIIYRNYQLGYLGERYVGEQLALLEHDGFQVFHDIPNDEKKTKFNLDHVVVGPTGVWLIETKTRRKGRSRPGFKEHEVVFDGCQLIWPWGEDHHGLDQTANEVRWLKEWIKTRTSLVVDVRGILTLPGWMVIEKAHGQIRVLNTKNLPSAIRARGERVLTEEQTTLIALQLDLVCRDVVD